MKRFIFVFMLIAALSAVSASAEEWLVGMEDGAVMLAGTEAEHIAADVYKTDYDTAVSLMEAGAARYMEPDGEVRLCSEPNDPAYSRQWWLSQFDYPSLWNSGYTGEGVTVAVVDSGINMEHEELTDNIAGGYDYVDGDDTPDDVAGHGTVVSGIIAAETNNSRGIAGMAGKAQIIPLKFTNGQTSSVSSLLKALSDIADGRFNCDVLNLSIEMDDYISIREVLERINGKGVIIVAAVGNYEPETVRYPAGYDFVIGVNSVDRSMQLPDFAKNNGSVFVAAAGRSIYSTWIGSSSSYSGGMNGTSYSAPIISGLAAAARQADPNITTDEVKLLLRSSAIDCGEQGYDTAYGWGVVDFGRFADCLKAWTVSKSGIPQAVVTDEATFVFGSGDTGGEVIVGAYEDGRLISWGRTAGSERWMIQLAGVYEDSELRCFYWDSLYGMGPNDEVKIVNKIF